MINKRAFFNEAKGYFFMLLGCLSYGVSTSLFLAPNNIVAGGVSGIAVIINKLWNMIPMGVVIIAVNIPIAVFGFRLKGWKYILKSFITVFFLSLFTDLLTLVPSVTDNEILASLYGGVCQGIGIGLFIKYQFSSGGTEMLGGLLGHYIRAVKVPVWIGILDGIVVISGTIIFNRIDNMLYALIVVFVSTKISEVIYVGVSKSKLCFIISDKGKEIADDLIEKSPRGVTLINGEGMYTHNNHDVLLTCVKNRQLEQLKNIVKNIDDKAFIIINDSVEVRGKGFSSLTEK